ncbi:MAG TPA: GldG family protein [Thermoanaerobaculia bacterium]|nr:GldG family protein [Thermoanaerobaculia bacterium]
MATKEPRNAPPASRRQLVRTGTLSAGVLLVAALFLIFNYLGWKYHHRFDWTAGGVYSLSQKSRNVIKELKRDVEFVVFIAPGQELYDPVHEILSQYDAASQRIKVRYFDPERHPVEAQQLVQQYGVSSTGLVVVVSGTDRRVIDSGDLAELDYSGMQMGEAPKMTGFKGEQLFTGALLQLSEGHKPKIVFTTGHGERSLDDRQVHGLSSVHDLLGRDNFELEEWASRTAAAVPNDADLLVIAGPTSPFIDSELKALTDYLNGGGRMLVLVDPTLGQTPGAGLIPTGLTQWLAGYGVKLGDNIVIDPKGAYPGAPPYTLYTDNYGEQPITKPLSQSRVPVLLNVARSVQAASAGVYQPQELLRTTEAGWGETNLGDLNGVEKDAQDLAGPVSLGVAVEGPKAGTKRPFRLVVLGDSDLATNQLVEGMPANAVLLANSLNWLAEREALLSIPPKKTENVRLNLTADQLRTLWLTVLLFLPLLAIALGTAVYFRRRR